MHKEVCIAIIDSGIHYECVQNQSIISSVTRIGVTSDNYGVLHLYIDNNIESDDYHGTKVFNTIEKYSSECRKKYYIFNVFQAGKASSISVLKALEYCLMIDKLDMIVISLSCSKNYYKQYAEVLSKLSQKGILTFASLENNKKTSIPAEMPNVYGVGGDEIKRNAGYFYDSNASIQFVANSEYEFLYRSDSEYYIFRGNSKANALVAGMTVKKISELGRRGAVLSFQSNISKDDKYRFTNIEVPSREDSTNKEIINVAIQEGLINSEDEIGKRIPYVNESICIIRDFIRKYVEDFDPIEVNYFDICSVGQVINYIRKMNEQK